MTAAELIAEYRNRTKDSEEPYFCDDDRVLAFLNEAQKEAAIRARLIFDADTEDVCQVAVEAETALYSLSEYVHEIDYAYVTDSNSKATPLYQISREGLSKKDPAWRFMPEGEPRFLIKEEQSVRLVPCPADDYTLCLEVYRTPVTSIALETKDSNGDAVDAVDPEIASMHHIHLVDWAEKLAYGEQDSDMYDPKKEAESEKRFSDYFGLAVDARRRQEEHDDVPHHNALW